MCYNDKHKIGSEKMTDAFVINYIDKKISESAIHRLEKYDWPGNIRELRQCLKRAIENSASGTIQAEHLDFGLFDL